MGKLLVRGFGIGLLLLTAIWLLHGDPVTDAETKRIAALILQLGEDDFERREDAALHLEKIGEKSLAALRHAFANKDLEVSRRAHEVSRTILLNLRTVKTLGMKLAVIDSGKFSMGSPQNQSYRRPDEVPHTVRLSRPFLIGAFEVTQEEYQKVMNVNPSWFATTGGGKDRVAGMNTSQFPVEKVTWFDAIDFCNRLSLLNGYQPYYKLTDEKREKDVLRTATVVIAGGNGYRLPTEAEWESACRAGASTAYHFGNDNSGREANLRPGPPVGYGGGPSWPILNRTTKVGSYPANTWGVYETHGNVGEWIWDWYDKDYYINSPGEDPTGPNTGTHRGVRGGSWMVMEGNCRSASRYFLAPDESKEFVGFRVARTP